ncbi:protein kinase domain-containing protein, partial [Nocardioides cheoyonin]|uniref:protein kinase domain-containing protein n=1 Tax=Nocardioides cheoyonin TaxID=3156615 RepID=UPI0032B4841A
MTDPTRREGHDDATRRESSTPLGAEATRREVPGAPGTRRETDANSTRRELGSGGGDLASSLGQFGLLAQVPSLAERYTLDRDATQKLGPEGGQAQLAVVRETNSEDRLVLKVYNRGTSLDERAMDKLIEMGRDTVGAQHVLPILDTGTDPHSGLTWEVQEYMAAGSLEQLFAQQTITPDFATALTREMSAALTFVHSRGVTHRDLKPGNILIRTLDPLDVVVADFGLAMQQDLSVVVRSVAGSWPYLPPESRANEFTPAMDWWALGLILAKGLTGRHMFQEPGGHRMLDDATIANQLARRTYTIPATGDERWDLLIAGLLTAEYRHRWSTAQVEEWLAGGSPEVHAPTAAADAGPVATVQPFAFAGADYDTPAALAAGFRTKWQEAGDLLIGRGREDLLTWLRRTTIGTAADAILDRKDLRNPEAPLLRLQVLLDPTTIPAFRGQTLSTDSFNTIIDQARNGDTKAVSWITGLRKERILSAWAGEAPVPVEIRRADDLLRTWWNNVENLLAKVPGEQAAQIRPALEPALLEAALNSDARNRISAAGQEVAAEASVLPDWAAPIKAAALGTTAGPEHAALALATLPAAEKTETARLKGIREAEERRQREQHE